MQFKNYLEQITELYAQAEVALQLQPPAQNQDMVVLENTYGFPLPAELKKAWLHCNGGGSYQSLFARPGYLTGYDFLSLDNALKERAGMLRRFPQYANYQQDAPRDERIKPTWYEPGWLPFASFGGATLLLILDFSPAEQGQAGQIIAFTHDADRIEYVAASFEEFLITSLEMFEKYSEEFIDDA